MSLFYSSLNFQFPSKVLAQIYLCFMRQKFLYINTITLVSLCGCPVPAPLQDITPFDKSISLIKKCQ